MAIVNKFAIFCAVNTEVPYVYKKKVFDAVVTSALKYSSETWIMYNPKGLICQYNQLIKCSIGVRQNTAISLCLVNQVHHLCNLLSQKIVRYFCNLSFRLERQKNHFMLF